MRHLLEQELLQVNKLYVFLSMDPVIQRYRLKNFQTYTAAPVGSVGDPLSSVRLKQSNPDMKMRWDKEFSGKNAPRHGSNIQDGYTYSFTSGGGPGRIHEYGYYGNSSFRTDHGWVYQDLRAPDVTHEVVMGSTGRYTYHNKIATLYEAKRTGKMFLPLPGEYAPTKLTRGNQVPRVVNSMTANTPRFGINGSGIPWVRCGDNKWRKQNEVGTQAPGTTTQNSSSIWNPSGGQQPTTDGNGNVINY